MEASYEVYNIASEGWITIDEVADEAIKAMGLSNVGKSIQTSAPRNWVARRRKENSFKNRQDKEVRVQKPVMNSREAVRTTVRKLLEEIDGIRC